MQACGVGFDFDHTLAVDHRVEIEAFVRMLEDYSVTNGVTFDAARASDAIAAQLGAYRAGKLSLTDAVCRAFAEAVESAPAPSDVVDEFRRLSVEMSPRFVQALPGVPEALQALDSAGVPYAILTNGWNPLQQCKADCIRFHKPVLVSDELGVRKPMVAAFEALSKCLRLPVERVYYVGDDPRVDMLGALSAGMKAVWFDWEGKKYPTDIPGPTAIIKDLRELPTLLPSGATGELRS